MHCIKANDKPTPGQSSRIRQIQCIISFIKSTVGIDFNVKDVKKDGNLYRLQMWDTAGQ